MRFLDPKHFESAEEFYNKFIEGQLEDQQDVELNLNNAAVIVIDMLNDFCTEGGVMANPACKKTYEPINNITEKARKENIPVIFVNDNHRPNTYDAEFDKRPVHCVDGTWGAEVVDSLTQDDSDIIVKKRRYSSFYQTDLEMVLRERKIETLIVCGTMTNICVRATAAEGFFRGFNVIVPSDCCTASSLREQESTLVDINTCYGLVLESDEILESL